jgi:hypothetical protein
MLVNRKIGISDFSHSLFLFYFFSFVSIEDVFIDG